MEVVEQVSSFHTVDSSDLAFRIPTTLFSLCSSYSVVGLFQGLPTAGRQVLCYRFILNGLTEKLNIDGTSGKCSICVIRFRAFSAYCVCGYSAINLS